MQEEYRTHWSSGLQVEDHHLLDINGSVARTPPTIAHSSHPQGTSEDENPRSHEIIHPWQDIQGKVLPQHLRTYITE